MKITPILVWFCLLLGGSHVEAFSLPDPTKPPHWDPSQVKSAQNLELSEIMTSSGQRTAIINGMVLTEGESIEGYTITQIKPDAVYLQGVNGSLMIPLLSQQVKREG